MNNTCTACDDTYTHTYVIEKGDLGHAYTSIEYKEFWERMIHRPKSQIAKRRLLRQGFCHDCASVRTSEEDARMYCRHLEWGPNAFPERLYCEAWIKKTQE